MFMLNGLSVLLSIANVTNFNSKKPFPWFLELVIKGCLTEKGLCERTTDVATETDSNENGTDIIRSNSYAETMTDIDKWKAFAIHFDKVCLRFIVSFNIISIGVLLLYLWLRRLIHLNCSSSD